MAVYLFAAVAGRLIDCGQREVFWLGSEHRPLCWTVDMAVFLLCHFVLAELAWLHRDRERISVLYALNVKKLWPSLCRKGRVVIGGYSQGCAIAVQLASEFAQVPITQWRPSATVGWVNGVNYARTSVASSVREGL